MPEFKAAQQHQVCADMQHSLHLSNTDLVSMGAALTDGTQKALPDSPISWAGMSSPAPDRGLAVDLLPDAVAP
jgi:hypothetical protein